MVSKFSLLINILLTCAALAIPSSQLEARLAHRQSRHINRAEALSDRNANVEYNSNWAGAVLVENGGTFTTVTGTFTVPAPTGSDGGATAWVGIDGHTCGNAIFQTGVDFIIKDGQPSYIAWYEWYPDDTYDFLDITIRAGDHIKTTVTAYSTTSGIAMIENLTNGHTVSHTVTSTHALCQENAEWVIEDYDDSGSPVPFANFGTVTFTNAAASGTSGSIHTPSGAELLDVKQNDRVLTSVATSGDTVTINYV